MIPDIDTTNKLKTITAAEEQFAREVTLGVVVQRPQSLWKALIPGMFIFDFLSRGAAIREYTRHFMYPRLQALELARECDPDQDCPGVTSRIRNHVTDWLKNAGLYSEDVLGAQISTVQLLARHYLKLIRSPGDNYLEMIQHAYQDRNDFQGFLDRIAGAEYRVDRVILEHVGRNKTIEEKMRMERQQVEKRRKALMDDVF